MGFYGDFLWCFFMIWWICLGKFHHDRSQFSGVLEIMVGIDDGIFPAN